MQTDGGSEFKDKFLEHVLEYCERHRVARPYKKNEQSYIESFNRTVRKECLGWGKYKQTDVTRLTPRVEAFLQRYHYHRPHLGLDPMRPPLQFLNPIDQLDSKIAKNLQNLQMSDIYGE